jgi:pimeloyl-ACP methyl ester carboxylesterase
MAAATPDASLTILPGLAHIPNMEDPAAFAAALSGWLGAAE